MKIFNQINSILVLLVLYGGIAMPVSAQLPPECSLSTTSIDCQIAIHGTNADQAEVWHREQQQINQKEAQRQWQIRENAVLADIAKERATPAYGALAISDIDSSMGGGLGYKSKEVAIQHAMTACKKGNCKILATFSNTCAAVASPDNSLDAKTVVVATDPDKITALTKVLRLCESKFGKDNCGMRNNAEPFCAGYDYGLYGK